MHTAQIRANFAQNQPSKRLLRKKAEKSRLMTLKRNPLSRALRRDSSPKGTPYGNAAKIPVSTKAVPLGKVAANEVSRRKG